MLLGDFKALSFDCYGTLIDWESGMIAALSGLTSRAGTSLTRDEILQAHARHESRQQAQTPTKPYRDLLPIVYKRLAEEWGVSVTNADCEDYGRRSEEHTYELKSQMRKSYAVFSLEKK